MNIIGRTLTILLAALLVAGATYALGSVGQSSSATGAAVTRDGGPPAGFQGGEGHRPGGDHDSGGAFGALEIGKNLAIMSIVVALVAGGTELARRVRPDRRSERPTTTA